MDDIDDLLDEIEREFDQKEKRGPITKPMTGKKDRRFASKAQRVNVEQEWDDIDQDIDDILDGGRQASNREKGTVPVAQKTEIAEPQQKKCFAPLLGGTNMTKGLCIGRLKRACDNLRCTSCDFKVVSFDNYQWHSSADYLFFRNTMPDMSKLQSKLRKAPNSVAYCCQCSWISVKEPTAINKSKNLKWVCGKH